MFGHGAVLVDLDQQLEVSFGILNPGQHQPSRMESSAHTLFADGSVRSDCRLFVLRRLDFGQDSSSNGQLQHDPNVNPYYVHATLSPLTWSGAGSSNLSLLVSWLYVSTSTSFRSMKPCSPPVNAFGASAGTGA
jgi:hypothetical protein